MFPSRYVCLVLWVLCMMGCGSGASGPSSQVQDPSSGVAVAGKQVKRTLAAPLDGNIGGYLEYLPGDYDTSNHTYPLIIFCHGSGEVGDGSSASLDNVAKNGVPRLIRDNAFPAGFTVGAETFSFIVVSPQFKSWPAASNIVALLNLLKNQGVRYDLRRVYLTGLSMGGGATWGGASTASSLALIAGVVPVCGAQDASTAGAQLIADAELPVWALHNSGDPTVSVNNTNHWIDAINSQSPVVPARKTIFIATGHDAWTQAYNPNYRETINGRWLNVYEWMLCFRKP
jgi:predicted peptidase